MGAGSRVETRTNSRYEELPLVVPIEAFTIRACSRFVNQIMQAFVNWLLGVHCTSVRDRLGFLRKEEDSDGKDNHDAESFDAEGVTL